LVRSVVTAWVLLALLFSKGAAAEEAPYAGATEDAAEDEQSDEPLLPAASQLQLESPRRFAVAVEAFTGLALEWVSAGERPHGVVGGLARVAYRYFEAGASAELTDSGTATSLLEAPVERWTAVGGFLGARLPYRHWVDFDFSLGLESRHYRNSDWIYGPNGFDVATTALTFRGGISDRSSEKWFGARVGAALVGGIDFDRLAPTWTRTYLLQGGGVGKSTGTTPIGGVSIALVVSVALEASGGPRE
jgi:hypothetical protein